MNVRSAAPAVAGMWPSLPRNGLSARFSRRSLARRLAVRRDGLGRLGLAVVLWWRSSAARRGSIAGRLGSMFAALAATCRSSMCRLATGAMGMLFPMLGLPVFALHSRSGRWSAAMVVGLRRATMVFADRGGVRSVARWCEPGDSRGAFDNDFAWRWTPTPEDRGWRSRRHADGAARRQPGSGTAPATCRSLPAPRTRPRRRLARCNDEGCLAARPHAGSLNASLDWPGFRGRDRDGVVRGVRIATDWSASPPKELWRRPIGPGWSSFAVHGDVFYTQEQRGDEEIVAAIASAPARRCGSIATGRGSGSRTAAPVRAARRRCTTAASTRFGATGILNVLDEATGGVIWSRNAGTDSDTKIPDWGFSASPLLIDDLVIVAAAGKLVAYDCETGAPRWVGPDGGPATARRTSSPFTACRRSSCSTPRAPPACRRRTAHGCGMSPSPRAAWPRRSCSRR